MKSAASCILRLGVLALIAGLAACSPSVNARLSDTEVWRAYEKSLIAKGKLKTERAPADTPYSNEALIRSFREICGTRRYTPSCSNNKCPRSVSLE